MKFGSLDINSLIPSAARIKAALESLTSPNKLAGSAIGLDTTNLKIATGANLQVSIEEADVALVNARSTGVRYGGFPTPVGGLGAGTTVNITAGHGQILNNTDAANPSYTKVFWTAKTGLAIANTGVSQTYWYVDDNSDVVKQQTTEPTRSERRTKLFLFRTSLTSGVISAIESEVNPAQQIGSTIRDLADAIGVVRAAPSSLIPSKGTGALKLAISAGALFRVGGNWSTSYADPNFASLTAFDSGGSSRFRYAIPSGPIAVDLSDIQVANYAPGGVVTAIPGASTRVGLHFIFRFPAGNCRIVYGSSFYTNLDEAIAAIGSIDPFTLAPSSFAASGFCIGAIAATKSETDLANARFVTTNRYGIFSGGVVAQLGALLRSNNLSDVASPAEARRNLGVAAYRLNPVSHTGSTASTEVGRITFPAGTFQEGDFLVIWMNQGPRGSVAGTVTANLQFYSDTTNRTIWNPAAANTTRNIIRSIYFENGLWSVHADDVNITNFSNYGTTVFRQNITFSQPSSLRVNFTLSNAADTYWLNYLVVNHFRSAVL